MKRKTRGMTLAETMYAVFITAVSAGVLMAAMPAATMAYTTASDEQHALNLAQKELESIRNQGFPNLNPTQLVAVGLLDSASPVAVDTYTFNQVDAVSLDNVASILPSGNGTVRIDTVSSSLSKVTVVITWVDHGITQSYELTTLLANI